MNRKKPHRKTAPNITTIGRAMQNVLALADDIEQAKTPTEKRLLLHKLFSSGASLSETYNRLVMFPGIDPASRHNAEVSIRQIIPALNIIVDAASIIIGDLAQEHDVDIYADDENEAEETIETAVIKKRSI